MERQSVPRVQLVTLVSVVLQLLKTVHSAVMDNTTKTELVSSARLFAPARDSTKRSNVPTPRTDSVRSVTGCATLLDCSLLCAPPILMDVPSATICHRFMPPTHPTVEYSWVLLQSALGNAMTGTTHRLAPASASPAQCTMRPTAPLVSFFHLAPWSRTPRVLNNVGTKPCQSCTLFIWTNAIGPVKRATHTSRPMADSTCAGCSLLHRSTRLTW